MRVQGVVRAARGLRVADRAVRARAVDAHGPVHADRFARQHSRVADGRARRSRVVRVGNSGCTDRQHRRFTHRIHQETAPSARDRCSTSTAGGCCRFTWPRRNPRRRCCGRSRCTSRRSARWCGTDPGAVRRRADPRSPAGGVPRPLDCRQPRGLPASADSAGPGFVRRSSRCCSSWRAWSSLGTGVRDSRRPLSFAAAVSLVLAVVALTGAAEPPSWPSYGVTGRAIANRDGCADTEGSTCCRRRRRGVSPDTHVLATRFG